MRRSRILLLVVLAGCASRDKIKSDHAKGQGTAVVYEIDPKAAFEIGRTVLFWEGAKNIDEYPEEGYMLCRISGGYGCGVGVWYTVEEGGKTKVTVLTRRNMSMSLTTGLTETTFQKDYGKAVEIRASGKDLPQERPADAPEKPK
jgi:hypothetical protein